MRTLIVVSLLLASLPSTAPAQIDVVIGLPEVRLRFSQPEYPRLELVPGYPVYYAPESASNYFFYDGLYWVYERDTWYASSWFDGPWSQVSPQAVPLFILRVPVRYYRRPPDYFHGWRPDAPPRWGDHWGRDWQRQRGGWDRWDHREAPAVAPLPAYQRHYAGARYPRADQQQALRAQNYRHEPRDEAAARVYQAQAKHPGRPAGQAAPAAPPARPQAAGPPPGARQPDPRPPARPAVGERQRGPERRQQPEPGGQAPDQGPRRKKGAPQEPKEEDRGPPGEGHGEERGGRR